MSSWEHIYDVHDKELPNWPDIFGNSESDTEWLESATAEEVHGELHGAHTWKHTHNEEVN
jgi:hypothetical protein